MLDAQEKSLNEKFWVSLIDLVENGEKIPGNGSYQHIDDEYIRKIKIEHRIR